MVENLLGLSHAIEARGWRGDKQALLLFTSNRIIVLRKGWLSDIAGSSVGYVIGGLLLGGPLDAASRASDRKKVEQMEEIDFDQIIAKQKGSYAIQYDDITKAEMKEKWLERWLEIKTKDTEHRFKRFFGEKGKEGFLSYDDIAQLLKNEISSRLNYKPSKL